MNTLERYIIGVSVILLGSLSYSQGIDDPHFTIQPQASGILNVFSSSDPPSGTAESTMFTGALPQAPEDKAGNTNLFEQERSDTMRTVKKERTHSKQIIGGVLKTVSLGMAACSLTMGIFGEADVNTQMTMLGLGVFTLAVASIQDQALKEKPVPKSPIESDDGIGD
ncbi:MAG: hypothetical protein JSW54_12200 [Fidelibacterota bacterium]|nr:MAG: hypothetical protein JSW54_12200 [Candidatus Neomarinimicrobiota bacterium]